MQVNKVNSQNWKKALTWVIGLEILMWTLFAISQITLDSFSSEDFLIRYPKVLWFNIFALPFYYLLFRQRINLSNLISKIPERLAALFLQFPSEKSFWRKWILFRFAIFFFLIALSQPLFGTQKGVSLEKNSEVVIAMDVSNSMNTKDIDPDMSRLEIAKRATIQLINGLQGERLGVLIFAGNAYVQLPITKDYSAAKLFINEIDTKMLSNQGTNFAAALEKARGMFSEGNAGKCILMVTDGENHEEIPDNELKKLPKDDIFLAVVGLGTANGGLIPRDPEQPILGYVTDENGRPVLSKVGTKLVRDLAKKASGIAMVTDDSFPNLSNLLTEINQLSKGDLRNLELDVKVAHYHWPLLVGLALWLLFLTTDQLSLISSPTNSVRKANRVKND
jgi:Ca-activated chloride channel family protein